MRVEVEINQLLLQASDLADFSALRDALATELAGPLTAALRSDESGVASHRLVVDAHRVALDVAGQLEGMLKSEMRR